MVPASNALGDAGKHSVDGVPDELAAFTTDLTGRAERGLVGELVGREDVINDLIAILACKEANNAVLLGDAGVGKTRIVEGLAKRFLNGAPHPRLPREIRLLNLDLGLLVAGAQYLGQFEDRLRSVLRSLREAAGKYILFIDEIHLLLGLGKTSGAMDAANLMKPALARGELWCIGATTYTEFRLLEADPALRRRFQSVDVPEQSVSEVELILNRLAPVFEGHHGVKFGTGTTATLARLARRYLGESRSPGREIALLDEIGARSFIYEETPTDNVLRMVGPSDVKKAIARRTGIPVDRIGRAAAEAVKDLENRLRARVFGQDHVIQEVAKAIRRASAGLNRSSRPRAVFLFAGPSGVGKTELAKALAEQLYDTPESVIRLDMSEFNSETARTRLIGSDPGFIGYEEGGRLTEAVRRRPYSLVLLDEFEKAHPTVWRLFLQVFDDGRLTDAKGRTVNFSETVIVLTSNVGAQLAAKARELYTSVRSAIEGASDERAARSAVSKVYDDIVRTIPGKSALYYDLLTAEAERALMNNPTEPDDREITRRALLDVQDFPPELFGRIGPPLVFHPLGPESLRRVLEKCVRDLCIRIAANRYFDLPQNRLEQASWLKEVDLKDGGYNVTCGPVGKDALVGIGLPAHWCQDLLERGQDPIFGARALETLFAAEVEVAAADAVLGSAPHDPWLFKLDRPSGPDRKK